MQHRIDRRGPIREAFLILVALLALTVTSAAMADESRLTLDLNWVNVERRDPALLVYKSARVIGASVVYQLYNDGTRNFAIFIGTNGICSTSVPKAVTAVLVCGSVEAQYNLVQYPGKMTHVEFVRQLPTPVNFETPK